MPPGTGVPTTVAALLAGDEPRLLVPAASSVAPPAPIRHSEERPGLPRPQWRGEFRPYASNFWIRCHRSKRSALQEDVPDMFIMEYAVESDQGRKGTFMIEYKTWAVNVTSVHMFLFGHKPRSVPKALAGRNESLLIGATKGGCGPGQGWQGSWIRYDDARDLLKRVCFTIADKLVPIFGPSFPDACLRPGSLGYGHFTLKEIDHKMPSRPIKFSEQSDSKSAAAPADAVNEQRRKPRKRPPPLELVFPGGSAVWVLGYAVNLPPAIDGEYLTDPRSTTGCGIVYADGFLNFFFDRRQCPIDPEEFNRQLQADLGEDLLPPPLDDRQAASSDPQSTGSAPPAASSEMPIVSTTKDGICENDAVRGHDDPPHIDDSLRNDDARHELGPSHDDATCRDEVMKTPDASHADPAPGIDHRASAQTPGSTAGVIPVLLSDDGASVHGDAVDDLPAPDVEPASARPTQLAPYYWSEAEPQAPRPSAPWPPQASPVAHWHPTPPHPPHWHPAAPHSQALPPPPHWQAPPSQWHPAASYATPQPGWYPPDHAHWYRRWDTPSSSYPPPDGGVYPPR